MRNLLHRITLFILLCPTYVMAQWSVGIDAGADFSQPRVNTQYAYTRNYFAEAGAILAVPVQYNFLDWVGLVVEPGLQYRSNGYNQASIYIETQRNLYLEVPVMANFSFGSTKVRGFVNLGGYIGGWLAGWRSRTFILEQSVQDCVPYTFTAQQNRFDAGLVGGVGLKWFCHKPVSMSLQYRYYYDLISCEKPHRVGTYDRFDNLHTLTLGVHFNLVNNKNTTDL